MRTFIHPSDEAPAIRRAGVLVERVYQDAGGSDTGIELLRAELGRLRRAAAAGRAVHHSAIDRMEVTLARITTPVAAPFGAGIEDIIRLNALVETRNLLARLARPRATAVRHPD